MLSAPLPGARRIIFDSCGFGAALRRTWWMEALGLELLGSFPRCGGFHRHAVLGSSPATVAELPATFWAQLAGGVRAAVLDRMAGAAADD